jgi:hypothetical protein
MSLCRPRCEKRAKKPSLGRAANNFQALRIGVVKSRKQSSAMLTRSNRFLRILLRSILGHDQYARYHPRSR